MGKPWEKYGSAQPQTPTPAPAPAPATNNVVAGPWAKYKTNPTAAFAQPKQSSYDEMAATPQRSVAGSAPQWAAEAPLMGGRTIQDEGREALQSAGTKLRVKTAGTQLDNRHNAEAPDLVGGIGDLLKAGNFAVRDWWKNSSDKEKENLIASIPVEATGAGAIARLSDHIGQKTGNDFLIDKTGNFKTDANYDPVAELELYLVNAGTWSTRNAAGNAINPRGKAPTVGPQLPGMRQALAKPTLSEIAPAAADVATNMTMGLSDVGAASVRGVAGLANDLRPRPAASAPQPAPAAAGAPPTAPQSAPVAQAPIPQAAPRAAQPGPSSAGQGAGVSGPAQSPGVLNAAPATVGQSPVAMAKSDARIIGRLLKAGGVARNDVNNLLAGLVQAYQSSNSSRLPLAFFAEEYLPTVLPKQTADDVIQKLRGFGRERYSANGPKDTSRSTMRNTVDTLRSTQQDNLSGVMDANLYKGKLIGQEDKLNAALEQNARTAYQTALENANNRLLSGRATQAERDALGEIQALLHNGAFLKEVPAHLRIKAMREGIDLEDFVQKDPIAAAHWLQSELRQAVTAAEGVGGAATSESRLYGEMRTTLLEQLEKVVPGYRGARKAHGDIYGAKEAIEFGGNFFKAARSEVETARLARQFKAMSTRQKTAATMSIRDALKNEFRNKAEDTAAKVTRLQQAGVLDALETVLGADGKRVADAIRNTVKENERLRAVDMLSGSNTADNLKQMEAAQEAVRSPVNKAIGSLGDNRSWAATLTGDALLAASGLPPVLTGGKIATSAIGRLGKPSPRKLASATKTLYDLPTPSNALAAPKPARASGPRAPKPKPTPEQVQATLDDLLRQYDALDHRADPAAGQKLLRQIDRLKKQLATPNALASPPKPPAKAGFGGSKQPLPMDEASRMQRAREQGFDVDTPLYHGTSRDIIEFQVPPPFRAGLREDNAVFLTDAPDLASSYAKGEGANVMPVFARLKKPFIYDAKGENWVRAWPSAMVRAKRGDFDGVIVKNVDDWGDAKAGADARGIGDRLLGRPRALRTVYAVFDPANIRSKNATFDPAEAGSSKLLAGMGATPEGLGMAGGGVAGYAFAPDQNDDGVVDAQERAAGGLGGLITGAALVKGARMGGNALRNIAPSARPPVGPAKLTFGGVNAKTADLKLHRIAQDMEKAGASRDQIWKETGWFKGNDGKWRFEIDDSKAGFNAGTKRELETKGVARVGKGPNGVALKTAFNHSEAGNAYPQYAWTALKGEIRPGVVARGTQAGSPYGNGGPGSISFRAPDLEEGRSVVLHEGQHGVQDVEGFARGGTPDQQKAALKAQRQSEVQPIHDEMRAVLQATDRNTYETWNEFALARVNGDVDRISQIEDMLAATEDGKKLLDLDWKARSISSGSVSEVDSFDAYRRLAGEVEARNVQTRRDFTPEERRARPPWTTQDVPDDQQIVRYGAGRSNAEPLRKIDEPVAAQPQTPGEVISVAKGPGFKGGGGGGFRGPPTDPVPASVRYGVGGMAGGGLGMAGGGAIGSVADLDGDGVAGTQNDMRIGAGVGLGVGIGGGLGTARMMRGNALKRAALPSGKAVEESADAILQRHGYRNGISAQKAVIETLKAEGASPDRINIAERILTAIQRRGKEGEAVLSGEKLNSNVASIKPPPTQAGFGGGRKPPGNALAGPPKKPAPVLSRAAEEATRELKAARSAYSRASNKWVMKDDRELRVKPLEERVVAAEKRLAEVLKNDARIKVAGARIKGTVEKTLNSQTRSVLGGVGLGVVGSTGLILGYNALSGPEKGEKPMSPKDPRWFWSTVQNDKQTMVNVQKALREWGEWPQEETRYPNGAVVRKDVEMTGRFGKTTKDALRAWRYARGLDPDAPMSKQDLARLIAGPTGYQSDDGAWRYPDGESARAQ